MAFAKQFRSKRDPQLRLQHKLVSQIAKTSVSYNLFQANDRILVAMSGGKDSYALLLLLDALNARLPFACEFIPVFVDQGLPEMDITPLRNWLQKRGGEFEIVVDNTHRIVVQKTREGQQPCPLCARLRRGILYSSAARLKCNKIALGHHRDDALATLMMNLFYSGSLKAMPARYQTDNGKLTVLRPMIEIAEREITQWITNEDPPILASPFCANLQNHQREAMDNLLSQLERQHPQLRNVMLAALKHVKADHLLDPQLLDNSHFLQQKNAAAQKKPKQNAE